MPLASKIFEEDEEYDDRTPNVSSKQLFVSSKPFEIDQVSQEDDQSPIGGGLLEPQSNINGIKT